MLDHLIASAASFSGDVDGLFVLITVLVGVWFIAAEAMFFWLIFRFRAKDGEKAQYVTGKEKHLKKWINIPHALVLVCDVVIIVAAIRVWVTIKQTLPPADRTVRVVAQQWAWTFADPGPDQKLDTPDDIRTTDELHVEVGKTYHFLLESKDVVHSFFVPAFRLKQDADPGRIYTGWFKPTKTGSYDILCAEICGIGHGVMGALLVVDTPEAFQAWEQAHAAETPAEAASATESTPAPAAGQ
ncbi:MAG: cytochrome c oxidase subunit II [Candidatus Eisenbacteria bacterium]|nr:cytochrome c oxidase subunit II [Candidatus Eisenbacteria bacterium]